MSSHDGAPVYGQPSPTRSEFEGYPLQRQSMQPHRVEVVPSDPGRFLSVIGRPGCFAFTKPGHHVVVIKPHIPAQPDVRYRP